MIRVLRLAGLAVMVAAAQNGYLPPTFVTLTLPDGTAGKPYQAQIRLGRNSTVPSNIILLADTQLPSGLSLGVSYQQDAFPAPGAYTVFPIGGTPTQAGTYQIRFEAWEDCPPPAGFTFIPICGAHLSGHSSPSVYRTLSLTIASAVVGPTQPAPLKITTTQLPAATYGSIYSAPLNATGGTGNNRQWSAAGSLPSGVVLGPAPGLAAVPQPEVLAGCPSQTGTYQFSISVSESGVSPDTRQFTVSVQPGTPPITVQPQGLPSGTAGKSYTPVHLTATLGCLSTPESNLVWGAIPGTLPSGMQIGTDGIVSGTPAQAGQYTVKVLVADGKNPATTASLALTIQPGPPPLTVSLLDPVPLMGTYSMLSGPYVSSTPSVLAGSSARAVQGISADGFSQLVVRIPSDKAGRTLNVQVLDENGLPGPPQFIGGVARPEDIPGKINHPLSAAGQFLVVTSTAINSNTSFAFAVYVSPPNFDRTSPEPGTERSVTLRATSDAEDGPQYQDLKIRILRPPVFLVHGMNADPSVWDQVVPVLGADFKIFRADYGQVVSVLATQPFNMMQSGSGGTLGVKRSALGFTYNAPFVFTQLQQDVDQFRSGQNPAGIPVAAVQADVVAHSMGGLVSRMMTYLSGYYGPQSLTGGYIHKLITVGTPHLGTPYASFMADPTNGCARILNNIFEGDGFILQATVQDAQGVHTVNGALNDLRGTLDGKIACSAGDPNYNAGIYQIHQPATGAFTQPLRTAMLAGVMTSRQLQNLSNLLQGQSPFITGSAALKQACPTSSLAGVLTPAAYSKLMGDQSDALVTPLSAHDGSGGESFDGVHSPYTALIGFGNPHLMEPSSGAPARVKDLLYTPASNSAYVSLPLASPCSGN